jgi:hypothetical protein
MSLEPKIISVDCIWGKAKHNAFTDLIYFQGKFLCCFREADEHAGGKNGKIRILSSKNGKEWDSIALISLKGVDLRDPMLSEMPDGRLMLNMGGSIFKKEKLIICYPRVAFSENGSKWSSISTLDMPWEWIWRVTWHKGIGYGVSYGHIIGQKRWIIRLYKTTNGLDYSFLTRLKVVKFPSETTLRFLKDDTMVALIRRHGPAMIGTAKAPYMKWKLNETDERLGGPNFLVLDDGRMFGSGRLHRTEKRKKCTYTALAKMSLTSYEPLLVLPSGGDTSYPGMVYKNGKMYLSYYSSHEGKSKIYFATIKIGV